MKDEKKSSITDSQHTLSGSKKTQKVHNKHFDHDKVVHDHQSLRQFLASRLFQGSRSESALVGLSPIIDPWHLLASSS
jgi:hypothetical protein